MQMTIIYPDKKTSTFNSGTTTNDTNAQKITNDTLFQIGSETKSYTAALIVKLDALGRLSLDDKVGKYFPEYQRWRNISIWQLLHNNSGIPNYSENKAFQKAIAENPQRSWTPKELLAIATKMPIAFSPRNSMASSHTISCSSSGSISESPVRFPQSCCSVVSCLRVGQTRASAPRATRSQHGFHC